MVDCAMDPRDHSIALLISFTLCQLFSETLNASLPYGALPLGRQNQIRAARPTRVFGCLASLNGQGQNIPGEGLAEADQRKAQPREIGFVRSLFKIQPVSKACLSSQVGTKAGN